MLANFKKHIEDNFPNLLQEKFIVAASGGVDSMVMMDLCATLKLDFAVAHCNFRLRGAESDADEKLVSDVAASNNKFLFVTHFDTIGYLNKNKLSLQVGARQLRYEWFADIMSESGINTLVTAHHADDSLETFLINLSRGTGIDGLSGIPEKTDFISRPLLQFSRQQILDHAKERGLQWREDASNKDTKYLRNKIRHQLVPTLKELSPNFLDNFKSTQKYLSQTAEIVKERVAYLKNNLFVKKNGVVHISIEELDKLHPLEGYLYALFQEYGFTEIKDLVQLTKTISGKELISKTHRLIKDRGELLLTEMTIENNVEYSLEADQFELSNPISLTIKEVEELDEIGEHILYVDKDALNYPLTIRNWQNGDYFHPLGMRGKKKLSKYFKDEKVDILTKEQQWLLCSQNEIVWVIGRRADERFKVTDKTKKILKFILN
ncbi:tRNA lysidine(34) synthetase TilS [Pseudozobellia sp. WGM2]|uniref:tRNA lysidine(34) synthetase TilS n=1 Tax=Pseudozobellia sp. WGM2 TaxID=2787625 RepID=UPI001ADFBA09